MLTEANPQTPTVVYTPESQLRQPGRLLRGMFRDLVAARELAWRLFVRNISARYRQTMLGYVWAFLPPIVSTLVFVFLRNSGLFTVGDTVVPYVVFVFSGMILWQTFADALNSPIRMVAQSKAILAKINFPHEALILAGIAEVLFNFMIRLALLIAVLLWFGIQVPLTALLVPCGVLALIGLGIAAGVLLIPLAMLYQDVEQVLPVITPFWMFVTPVLYPPTTSWPGSLTMALNPVSPVLDTTRAWLLSGSPGHVAEFAWVIIATLILLFFGWGLYRLALPILIERTSA